MNNDNLNEITENNMNFTDIIKLVNFPQINNTIIDYNSYLIDARKKQDINHEDVKPITNLEMHIIENEKKKGNIVFPSSAVSLEKVELNKIDCIVNKCSNNNIEAVNKSSIKYSKYKNNQLENIDKNKEYKYKIIKKNNIKLNKKYNEISPKEKKTTNCTKKYTNNKFNKQFQQLKKHKYQEENNKFKHDHLDSTNILTKKIPNSDKNLKILKVDNVDSKSRISKINSSLISKIFYNKKKLNNKIQNYTDSSDEETDLNNKEYSYKLINKWRVDFLSYDFKLNMPIRKVYEDNRRFEYYRNLKISKIRY